MHHRDDDSFLTSAVFETMPHYLYPYRSFFSLFIFLIMRFSRSLVLAASASAACGAHAFLAQRGTIAGARALLERNKGHHNMIFDKLFGGGAFESKIPYDNLDFPGPELAKLAEANEIPSNSPSKPNLEIGIFAGGCFCKWLSSFITCAWHALLLKGTVSKGFNVT